MILFSISFFFKVLYVWCNNDHLVRKKHGRCENIQDEQNHHLEDNCYGLVNYNKLVDLVLSQDSYSDCMTKEDSLTWHQCHMLGICTLANFLAYYCCSIHLGSANKKNTLLHKTFLSPQPFGIETVTTCLADQMIYLCQVYFVLLSN